MATTEKGMYHPYGHHRGVTVGSFSVNATGPAIAVDPGGIVRSVASGGVGILNITLKRRYARIQAIADTDQLLLDAKVTSVTAGGAAANVIQVTVTNKAGAANAGAAIVMLSFFGYDS